MIDKPIKATPTDLILLLGIGAVGAWLLYQALVTADYHWNWQAIPQYLLRFDKTSDQWVPGLIFQGLLVTLRLSFWATALALIMGVVMGLFRTSCSLYRRMIGSGYVALIRNIPVLVWIFIFYYFIGDRILPAVGIGPATMGENTAASGLLRFVAGEPSRAPAFVSGVLALAIYEGAYITEIIRAGIQSIDRGQWEASAGLGFSRGQQLRYIILPQAFRRILPPLAGQFISTIKDSAIVSVISIQELTFQGTELMAATFLTFEVWLTILVIYFIVCLTCGLLVERFEKRLQQNPQRVS
ncbi:amino acid ABC transporter permease [Desulfosarcina ovata]|uniref:Amino acid ABC transporter permease n=1 Tax=Desulfosarcina ovata subsp. ovata TaxID=2752305 RepID=A0A5K8ACL2_9BACT|nr:amino acid ABC transporter permease [Desulfosarcina ovata]BBO90239.1 amino acid ABC transporter permease [Desulfosarcina ovata subsp. ovata]